jgi:cytochrome c
MKTSANKRFAIAGLAGFLLMGFSTSHPALAADAAKGEKVFKKCMACHAVSGPTNKIGPHLVGIVNRPVAAAEGFTYSDAMKEYASGKVWDETALNSYLENPKAVVPKTKMAFAGLKKPEDRADLIAFLLTIK